MDYIVINKWNYNQKISFLTDFFLLYKHQQYDFNRALFFNSMPIYIFTLYILILLGYNSY